MIYIMIQPIILPLLTTDYYPTEIATSKPIKCIRSFYDVDLLSEVDALYLTFSQCPFHTSILSYELNNIKTMFRLYQDSFGNLLLPRAKSSPPYSISHLVLSITSDK
jgi:hypothetical protein